MSDINYCPGCGSAVDVEGGYIEDREIATCPECGVIEVVFYDGLDRDWLEATQLT